MDAFKEFMEYAERAIGKPVSTEIYGALTRELLDVNSRRGHNGQGRIYPSLTTEQTNARGHALRHALSERFAPLLPAIREYVTKRFPDPAILNRLAWLADQVEVVILQDYPAHGFPREGSSEWRALKKGILDTIANLPTASVQLPQKAMRGNPERMEWNGSTIEFVTIFKNLLKSNYVELPSSGGKQGEGNVTEYIRRLQQTFIIRKEDETEFTPEGLADRWRGKPMGEEREKQFDIPEATRKRPRT